MSHLQPNDLLAIQWTCATMAWLLTITVVSKLLHLRAQRRRDALFEAMAREAMASGRPITFTHDKITRS